MGRKRDRGFLITAALAAAGGLTCVGASALEPRGGGRRLSLVPVPESVCGRVVARAESERKAA